MPYFFICLELSFEYEKVLPPEDYNEHELADFHENTKWAFDGCAHLLRCLIVMEVEELALSRPRARALAYLNDAKMYYKNARIRRTVESLSDSSTVIGQVEETLKLSQPTPNLEALIVEFKAEKVSQKQDHVEVTHLESFIDAELVV